MTTRSIRKRVDEHYRSIRLNQDDSNSAFARHILQQNHSFNPKNDVTILQHIDSNTKKLLIYENLEIYKHNKNEKFQIVNDTLPECSPTLLQLLNNTKANKTTST